MTNDIAAIAKVLRHSVITFGGVVQTKLGPQAADALSASLAREEVLTEALRNIRALAAQCQACGGPDGNMAHIEGFAKAALQEQPNEQ